MTKSRVFAITAAISWFAISLGFVLNVFDVYPESVIESYAYGDNPSGFAGVIGRTIDFFSYFTYVSNIVVAIVLTMLARNVKRKGAVFATLRMDSLVMISVTGLVYYLLLAADANPQGLQIVSNALIHYIIPALTIVIWLMIGPRGLFRLSTVLTALIIPVVWAVYAMIRGSVINAYPYGFLNAQELGLGTALTNILGVAILGVVLGLIYWIIDRLLSRPNGPADK
jgi:hypothetical protein